MWFIYDSLLSLHQKISQVKVLITVVVASGNDAGNACKGSPNAAPLSVNFTNYGQCIDAFSPGLDITSASAHIYID